VVLASADSDTPPQRFGDFADTVGVYLDEVKKLMADRRGQDEKRARLIADRAFVIASDPLKPVGAAIDKTATPFVALAPLENAVDGLAKAAKAYDAAYADKGAALAPATRDKLNALLLDIDQLLLDERGLPGRPWYQHLIYAPGRFTGYGAKTLPGVREAIEERRFDDANIYAERTGKVLEAYAGRLDQARALIEEK
jgi:N-acetylated-alpha-linked acidic dipeptidase